MTRRVALICRALPAPSGDPASAYALRLALSLASRMRVILCALHAEQELEVLPLANALLPLDVDLACLHLPPLRATPDSISVMQWLERVSPDLAVFVGCEELAYWPVMARHTRSGLLATPIVILSHAPSALVYAPQAAAVGPEELLQIALEHDAARHADAVIALNRRAAEALRLPHAIAIMSPPALTVALPPAGREARERTPRIILHGEVDSPRGYRLQREACEALLAAWPAARPREMLLVGGRHGAAPAIRPLADLVRLLRSRGVNARTASLEEYLADLQSGEATGDTGLFVDDDPLAFDALVALGGAGGLSAIAIASPHADLFDGLVPLCDDAAALARAAAGAPPPPFRAALVERLAESHERLCRLLSEQCSTPPLAGLGAAPGRPRVSVCISHFNRPRLLEQAVRSLRAQDHANIEIVIVDDCSPSAEARRYVAELDAELQAAGIGRVIVNDREMWQQESRNIAARAATGRYVLIMDDDNVARPDEISTMVAVAEHLGAKIVRCFQNNFRGDDYPRQDKGADLIDFYPTGGPLSVGTMWNVFGDVNVLYDRETFLRMGGFAATEGLGCEDFEIGIRAALEGVSSVTIPRVLYDYRQSAMNMAKRMDNKRLYDSHARLSALFEAQVPAAIAPVFRLINESFHRIWQRDGHAYWTRRMPVPGSHEDQVRTISATESEALFQLASVLLEQGNAPDATTISEALRRYHPQDDRLIALHERATQAMMELSA